MNNNEKKSQKQNIIVLTILALLAIAGIASRWQQTKSEIKSGVTHYFSADSTTNK